MENLTQEEIENYIDDRIEQLKPELKNRFVYNFRYDISEKGKGFYELAHCNNLLKPPLITFFIKTIQNAPDLSHNLLDELIKHEVTHTFYDMGERAATSAQKKAKFFINEL